MASSQRDQNLKLRENFNEDGEQTEYFKKLSDQNLEQCGTLAEQLICLRNDLDKSHFDILRIQRERSNSFATSKDCSFDLDMKNHETNSDFMEPEIQPKPAKMEVWNMNNKVGVKAKLPPKIPNYYS